jgi:hypothetical protein
MGRYRKVELEWDRWDFKEAIDGEVAWNGWGIYIITRKLPFLRENILYVGQTFDQTFRKRLLDHQSRWLKEYNGFKYVYFGELKYPKILAKDELLDIESAFIFDLGPKQNKQKKGGYNYNHNFTILNLGEEIDDILPPSLTTFQVSGR